MWRMPGLLASGALNLAFYKYAQTVVQEESIVSHKTTETVTLSLQISIIQGDELGYLSILSDYKLDDQGSIPSIETGLSLQPLCPDQL
jgi:hypothetical protein